MKLEENTSKIEKLVHDEFEKAKIGLPKILEESPDCSFDELQIEFEKRDIIIGERILLHADKQRFETIPGTQDFYAVIPYSGPLHNLLWIIEHPSSRMEYKMQDAVIGKDNVVKVLLEPLPNEPQYIDTIQKRNQMRKDFLNGIIDTYNEVCKTAYNPIHNLFQAHRESRIIQPLSEKEMQTSSPF